MISIAEDGNSAVNFRIEDLTSGEEVALTGAVFVEDGVLHLALHSWGPQGPGTAFAALQTHEGKVCLDVWSEEQDGATHSILIGPQRPPEHKAHWAPDVHGRCEHCGTGPTCSVCGRDDVVAAAELAEVHAVFDEDDGAEEQIDEMIHDHFSGQAACITDDSCEEKVAWLLDQGWLMRQIREKLNLE